MKILNCPTCGGHLELPDNLELAHCMYCGSKILVQDNDISKDSLDLKRFRELYKTSFDAKNYNEAIQYCNKVLEIYPKDIDAWIAKAISTFKLSTIENNRFEEAMKYLEKATTISPNDDRILNAQSTLKKLQGELLLNIGLEFLRQANEIYEYHTSGYYEGMIGKSIKKSNARNESGDYYIEAMNYFIAASENVPDDLIILSNIGKLANQADWISWNDDVKEKINTYKSLEARHHAIQEYPIIKKQLEDELIKLDNYKSNKGFGTGLKIRNSERIIKKLQDEKFRLEKYIPANLIKSG